MRAHALVVAASVAACSGIRADVEYDHDLDFRRFHTYSWGAHEGASSASVERRILAAVDRQLNRKGLARVERGGDLEVNVRATVDPAYDVIAWEHGRGPRWGGMPAEVQLREESVGAVEVELIDAATHRRAWRGRGVGALPAEPSPEERAARIEEGAAKLFRSFPPPRQK